MLFRLTGPLIYFSLWVFSTFRYRGARRVTRAGWLAVGALVASAVLGLDTNRTMAFQAFTFLLCLLVIAAAWITTFRPRVTILRVLPRYASVGETFPYRVRVRNHGSRALAGLHLLEDFGDPRPTLHEFMHAEIPAAAAGARLMRASARWNWLVTRARGATIAERPVAVVPPRGEAEVRVEAVPQRRGPVAWAGTTLARPDPFGLVNAFATVRSEESMLVLPRRYPLTHVKLPGTRKYQPGGVALASSVGDAEEFASLREYRPGDPLRRVHWRSWARTGKPVVKEYHEEFFVRNALVLDTFAPFPNEVFEEAISVAASFACAIETHEALLDLMFVGTEAFCFTSGRGVAHAGRMLEILAAVGVCRQRSFRDLHRLVLERAAALSGAICVLLAWDEDRRRFIDDLATLALPTVVLVVTAPGVRLSLDRPRAVAFHQLEVGQIAEGLARL